MCGILFQKYERNNLTHRGEILILASILLQINFLINVPQVDNITPSGGFKF